MNDRRQLLLALGGALAWPRVALSQQPGRTYRLGVVGAGPSSIEPYWFAFMERLGTLGFAEGRNLVVLWRPAGGQPEQMREVANDLARQKCDVLLPGSTDAGLKAIMQATTDTPIVMMAVDFDPVATGHITSLARPGGRVTGVVGLQSELPAKRLEVFRELLPKLKRVGVLANSAGTGQLRVTRAAAARLGIELVVHEFTSSPYDYPAAFAAFVRGKAEALVSLGSTHFVPARQLIPRLALEHRLPSIFHHSAWADAGGLISYGPNFSEIFRRAADQVAKILNGAKPGDLPVEQPNVVEMVINAKTAKALGVVVPEPIRVRADRLIV